MSLAITLPSSARAICLVMAALCMGAETVRSQAMLPFAPGERLEYTARVHVGVSGRGTLSVEGPSELRGTTTWTLRSDMEGRVGFLRASNQNVSWIDPIRMTALRYTSRERHLFSKHDDVVDIFTDEKRWSAQGGLEGQLTSDAPLDELSFLYYLRTLPLPADTTMTLARHFDSARNPTNLSVVGREEIEVGAGRFRAVIVEMRVRDTRRYRGEGVIRVYLSDDECRLILRLESDVPDAGKVTLALAAYSGARCACAAQIK